MEWSNCYTLPVHIFSLILRWSGLAWWGKPGSSEKTMTFCKWNDNLFTLVSALSGIPPRLWEALWPLSWCFRPLGHQCTSRNGVVQFCNERFISGPQKELSVLCPWLNCFTSLRKSILKLWKKLEFPQKTMKALASALTNFLK